jgi:O-methyltransferase
MNLIFICVFNQDKYVDMFFLLLESINIYGKLDNVKILIYTSTLFMNKIKESNLYNDKIIFEINDTYDNIDKACKARLDLFDLPTITNYDKILYLDTDIIVKDDINKVFDVCKEDVIYVLEEGEIYSPADYWGYTLFGDEINNYEDKSAFTSGILLFNNCEKIRYLFDKIKEDIVNRPHDFSCYDQPYIVYNAFKYNLYNNKILKSFVVNNDPNIHSDKVIHHFPGCPGVYHHKIHVMTIFLNNMKDYYKIFIEQILSNGFTLVSNERLQNLYNQCKKFNNTTYSFVECGVAKGGCLAMMKFASGKNKIFGFDSFEGMPDITAEDLGDYNKSCPLTSFGKVGDNLSGGIVNVYNTFDKLNLTSNNVTLVKGFFQDTLNKENIDNVGNIAVLRLDGDWYESTKICLDKLYDNVIEGGIIIIDDYGHWVGTKRAVDEFRTNYNISTPLIQTDYTEHYWIKLKEFDNRNDMLKHYCSKITNPKLLEIGVFKGDFLEYVVENCNVGSIDAVDLFEGITCSGDADGNNVIHYDVGISYIDLENKYKDRNVNIHKSNSVKFLQEQNDDIYDIIYIDGDHSYEGVKNDLINSYKKIKNGGYIMGHDYEMNMNKANTYYNFGTKQAVDDFCTKYNQHIISKAYDGCVSFCIQINKNV